MVGKLQRNVLANYLGQAWVAVMNIAFVPVYIRYLGIEAYGLIGLFAMIQIWLAVLDMGLGPTVTREFARQSRTDSVVQAAKAHSLLRSMELLAVLTASGFLTLIWAMSGWLARDWIGDSSVPAEVLEQAFVLMAAAAACRFVEGVYRGVLFGQERQVTYNAIMVGVATLRALGAVGLLVWVDARIEAFFFWQLLVTAGSLMLMAGVAYRRLPASAVFSMPSLARISEIGVASSGQMIATLLGILLTQADKVLLSTLLSLKAFGYYTLAGNVAALLFQLAQPVTQACLPRFAALRPEADRAEGLAIYRRGSQAVALVVAPAAAMLVVFAEPILRLWTADAALAAAAGPLLAMLAVGMWLNTLTHLACTLQTALGKTWLAAGVNGVALLILFPAIVLIVPRYGALGAAGVWVALNVGYVLFHPWVTFRFMKWPRFLAPLCQDMLKPALAAVLSLLILLLLYPSGPVLAVEVAYLAFAGCCALLAALLAVPELRSKLMGWKK